MHVDGIFWGSSVCRIDLVSSWIHNTTEPLAVDSRFGLPPSPKFRVPWWRRDRWSWENHGLGFMTVRLPFIYVEQVVDWWGTSWRRRRWSISRPRPSLQRSRCPRTSRSSLRASALWIHCKFWRQMPTDIIKGCRNFRAFWRRRADIVMEATRSGWRMRKRQYLYTGKRHMVLLCFTGNQRITH